MSLQRLLDSAAPARFVLEMIDHVEVVSDYVVNIHLDFPFAPFPSHLTHQVGFIVAPQAIRDEEAGVQLVTDNPIGTGPFMLDYRVVGDYSRLIPNPNHWRSVPAVSIMWRTVPDTDTRLAMLQTGEAHATHAQVADVPRLHAMSGVDLQLIEGATLNYVAFNTQRGALADRRVRQAISMAINRENLLYGLAEGQGTLAVGPIAPLVAYSPTVDALPFDPDRARELLEEAGFGDGLELTYWSNAGNAMRARAGELIQDDLRAIGIDLSLYQIEWAEYLERTAEGEHDMFYLGWQTMTMDADYGIDPRSTPGLLVLAVTVLSLRIHVLTHCLKKVHPQPVLPVGTRFTRK
jgi:peptide/nickel transport system substrate-binding protein